MVAMDTAGRRTCRRLSKVPFLGFRVSSVSAQSHRDQGQGSSFEVILRLIVVIFTNTIGITADSIDVLGGHVSSKDVFHLPSRRMSGLRKALLTLCTGWRFAPVWGLFGEAPYHRVFEPVSQDEAQVLISDDIYT
jgi:hypothetical protein